VVELYLVGHKNYLAQEYKQQHYAEEEKELQQAHLMQQKIMYLNMMVLLGLQVEVYLLDQINVVDVEHKLQLLLVEKEQTLILVQVELQEVMMVHLGLQNHL